ncbi:hypothetical protein A6768_07205 [Sphingobium yanoikuyae]|uniref:Uncharacterized protein n=1 Tax=Sphingobium yanoikuyae TaxID=13690 RepID=A0A291MXM8_SPHYA|nr:hypothetical protein A6768_07205 [Sphingobium yanoikuyae]
MFIDAGQEAGARFLIGLLLAVIIAKLVGDCLGSLAKLIGDILQQCSRLGADTLDKEQIGQAASPRCSVRCSHEPFPKGRENGLRRCFHLIDGFRHDGS